VARVRESRFDKLILDQFIYFPIERSSPSRIATANRYVLSSVLIMFLTYY